MLIFSRGCAKPNPHHPCTTMNYIKKLQQEVAELRQQVFNAHEAARHLMDYAHSDKFMGEAGYGGPTYINKNDVIHRVEPILRALPYVEPTDEMIIKNLRSRNIDERSIQGEDELAAAKKRREVAA